MYVSKALASLLFYTLAPAVEHVPVTIEGLDSSFSVRCGKTKVAGVDIYNAIAWAISATVDEVTFPSSDGDGDPYPHYYGNIENFQWETKPQCDTTSAIMPVIKNGFFGEDSSIPGKFRAVFSYTDERDDEEHPKGYYCGTIYHNSCDNSFAGCDVITAPFS